MKKLFITGAVFLGILCSSCSGSVEDRLSRSMQMVKESAELGTVEYSISKIIKVNDEAFYKLGERKILFSCDAVAKAGIDLSELKPENIQYDKSGNILNLQLPKPKILSFNMPAQDAKLVYQKVGSLRLDFDAEERNGFLKQGEQDIIANLPTMGIIEDAEENARLYFNALFAHFGFKNINITFVEPSETK